jgi:hypothetical protein
MSDNTTQVIKSRGYWRVNFRPTTYSVVLPSVANCREIVEKAAIQLRGWEYPAILLGASAVSRTTTTKYFELANNWENHIELWRMYKSSQFIHLLALREDWFERDSWRSGYEQKVPPKTKLALISMTYQATEIFTFLANLIGNGLYTDGVRVDISLGPVNDRELWIEDPRRVEFSYPRKTGEARLQWQKIYTKDDITLRSTELARLMLTEWFDAFDWHPSEELVTSDQEKLLTRQL